MKITVNQSIDCWVLCIVRDDEVLFSHSRTKLVDVIDDASLLYLRIDNIDDLPLTQYYKAEAIVGTR